MAQILLNGYSETVQNEIALAQRRAAEAEAKKLEELNHQRQLLQNQAQQGLSDSGPPASSPTQMPQLSGNPPLRPGPQPSFVSLSGSLGVPNGYVSASHVIVWAGTQATLWRQASPGSSQMLSAIQNNIVVQTNSSSLVGANAAQLQRFGTNSCSDLGVLSQGRTASSGSEVLLANRPSEQPQAEQFILAQSQLSKSAGVERIDTAIPEVGSSGLTGGMVVGPEHMVSENFVNVEMSRKMHMTSAGSAGSQAGVGVEDNGGNQITLTGSGSNSVAEDSSAGPNGVSVQELDKAAEDGGSLSSFNNDANVKLNGHGCLGTGRRNGVSSEGTPQPFMIHDGANAAAGLLGNVGGVDGSPERRNAMGEYKDISQNVSSGEKLNAGELVMGRAK